jgi:hypothetical protein
MESEMTRTTMPNDVLPTTSVSPPRVTPVQRARGVALILLGSLVALALVLGLVELGSSMSGRGTPKGWDVLALLSIGVLAGLTFVACGVQLMRCGKLGAGIKSVAGLVLVLLAVALWSVRNQLG